MSKLQDIFMYYILLLLGLVTTSWIIWGRFLRERVIRDIPDDLFTELRFWTLLNICFIYIYLVKNLIKPKEAHEFFQWLSNFFTTPLTTLDHFIKYNRYVKLYYYKFMFIIIDRVDDWNRAQMKLFVLLFDIIPRVILVFFLVLDIIYFKKLELFYKVVLFGVLPFILRYFLYCLKDLENHWVIMLEKQYDSIFVFEAGYEWLLSRTRDTEAKYHYEEVTVKEYIDIKYENIRQNIFIDDFPYKYVGAPLSKTEILQEYRKNKYNNETKLTTQDYEQSDKPFEEFTPHIMKTKMFIDVTNNIKQFRVIKYPKIIIFTIYFLCWSFILITNQYHYPVELAFFKYFVSNVMVYLMIPDDPFSMDFAYLKY